MSGQIIFRAPHRHRCDYPYPNRLNDFAKGDVWRCDECLRTWICTRNGGEGFAWKLENERQRNRRALATDERGEG